MQKKLLWITALLLIVSTGFAVITLQPTTKGVSASAINLGRTYSPCELPSFNWKSLGWDYNIYIRQNQRYGGYLYQVQSSGIMLDFNKAYWENADGLTKTIGYYSPTAFPIMTKPYIRFGYKNLYPNTDANISLYTGNATASYRFLSNAFPFVTWDSTGTVYLMLESDLKLSPQVGLFEGAYTNRTNQSFTTSNTLYIKNMVTKRFVYQFTRPRLFDSAGMVLDLEYVITAFGNNQYKIAIKIPREWLLDSAMTYPVGIMK